MITTYIILTISLLINVYLVIKLNEYKDDNIMLEQKVKNMEKSYEKNNT